MNKFYNFLIVFLFFSVFSCNKKTENFSCKIIHPQDQQEFYEDEDIAVSIETNDENSSTVLLYIDNKCYTGISNFPYNITIKAGDIMPGVRTLKAVAQNSDGKQSEASVGISIKHRIYESPDTVTFSDGKIPIGWKTDFWCMRPYNIDNSPNLFIYTNTDNATVTATKTCSYIEFYLCGYGYVYFYMDDIFVERFAMYGFDGLPQSWEEYKYEFPEGLHIFTWKFVAAASYHRFAGLDNISFAK